MSKTTRLFPVWAVLVVGVVALLHCQQYVQDAPMDKLTYWRSLRFTMGVCFTLTTLKTGLLSIFSRIGRTGALLHHYADGSFTADSK